MVVALLALLSALMLAPAGFSAVTPVPAPDVFKNVPVTGTTDTAGQTFEGTLDVQRFVVRNGELKAIGRLTGQVTDAGGAVVEQFAGKRVVLPVGFGSTAARSAAATCPILHLELGPLDLDLLGLVIHLDKVVLDITAQSGPGKLLGNLLCAIAGLLDQNAGPQPLAGALNTAARLLTGPDVFNDIPITGNEVATGAAATAEAAQPAGIFDGTVDIVRFVRDGSQLFAVARLTGTVTDAAGNVVGQVAGRRVRLPLQADGTCRILHLELGPLDLDLLGLMVHLDRVVLDITARSGPGNLLGNLLCAIAGLLDPPEAGSAARLNQLRRLSNATQNLPVTASATGGELLGGTLDVQRFVRRNGALAAVGRLSGALVDGTGNVQRFTDMLVTLPVRQITAVCQILHLELGPLDLDLLGLVVHLDRVVLDITAHSGPGRLLGNLLCGLAGLLDRPGALARTLNQNVLPVRLGR
jgi:hypothetical protein